MNILIFSASIESIYMGGHISSMLTISNELIKNNLNALVCLPKNLSEHNGIDEIEKLIPIQNIIWIPKSKYFSGLIRSKSFIYSIIKDYNINIIHSFDLQSHIISRLAIKKFNYKIKAISNVCGGEIKYKYPYVSPIMVFSEELVDQIHKNYRHDTPHVILEKSRMVPSFYLSSFIEDNMTKNLKKKIGDKKVILMVTRMSFFKLNAIILALNSIKKLASQRDDFIFILVGRINRTIIYENIMNRVDKINKNNKRQVILFDNNLSKIIRNIFAISDIVLGVAKVCFEGMLNRKPVLILGPNGCAGVVDIDDHDKFKKMVYNNFSSRDVMNQSNGTEIIISNLKLLLNSKSIREKLGKKNFDWVNNNLDIQKGAKTYISTYNSLEKMSHQNFLPLRFAYYGIIIIFLGKIKGIIRETLLRLKLK